MDLNFRSLKLCMWSCPLQMAASVHLHMHAANLDTTQSSSLHPPILSITAMEWENSACLESIFPNRTYHPPRTARIVSKHILSFIWLFRSVQYCATICQSFHRKGSSSYPTQLHSTEELCMLVFQGCLRGSPLGDSEGHGNLTTSTYHTRHIVITRNKSVERQVVVDILCSEYQAIAHMKADANCKVTNIVILILGSPQPRVSGRLFRNTNLSLRTLTPHLHSQFTNS